MRNLANMYTREDIYDLLHSVIPVTVKEIARKLKLPTVYGIGRLSNERYLLVKRLWKLEEIGAIEWIDHSGYILKERMPLEG